MWTEPYVEGLPDPIPPTLTIKTVHAAKVWVWNTMSSLTKLRTAPLSNVEVLFAVRVEVAWLCAYTEDLKMKAKGTAKTERGNTDWRGFVNISLTSEDKEAFRAWDLHDDDVWVLLSDTIVDGHKLSLTFNSKDETFVAAFTGTTQGDNAGYTMSAFARDWYTALRLLLFKHDVICGGKWDSIDDSRKDDIG